jgi:hypothetical protein
MKTAKDSPRNVPFQSIAASPRILSVSAQNLSPQPDNSQAVQGKRGSFFNGEKILLLITILSSLVALATGLWSLHKNSDLNTRLTKLTATVGEFIVKDKTPPSENKPKPRATAQAIKERLEQRRLRMVRPNVDLQQIAKEHIEQVKTSELENEKCLKEFELNTKRITENMVKNNLKMTSAAKNETQRLQALKSAPIIVNPTLEVEKPERPNPMVMLDKPLDIISKMKDIKPKKNGEMGIFDPSFQPKEPPKTAPAPIPVPNPIPEAASFGGVDLEDLERDILLIGGS